MGKSSWLFIVVQVCCLFSFCDRSWAEEKGCIESEVTVTAVEGMTQNELYELAKFKVCQKALVTMMQGQENAVLRKNWEILGAEREVFTHPQVYFAEVRIMQKERKGKRLRLRAEVVIDESALESLMNKEAGAAIEQLNSVGLSILFLARTAAEEIVYRENTVENSITQHEGNKICENKQKNIVQQTSYTTRAVDTTEILTNITSRLTDSGIRLFSVQALLPYIAKSERLEDYLAELKTSYAGYIDKTGVFRSGNTEKSVAYIQSEIKKIAEHPRYFALGKIDIGNTLYDGQSKLYRGIAKCSITLWDLDSDFFPVKIATTPLITAEVAAPDSKEAQKKAAEKVATETGNEILDRIRSVMLEKCYTENKLVKEEFDPLELLKEISIDVNEDEISAVKLGNLAQQYEKAFELYQQHAYQEAFRLFSQLKEQGYVRAQNMLGIMYANGFGVRQDPEKAVELLIEGAQSGDAEAEYMLGVLYATGIGVAVDQDKALTLFHAAAEKGNLEAIKEIGNYYLDKQQFAQALQWYRRAAERNFPKALYNIGIMYLNGLGVVKSVQEAISYFEKSALYGLPQGDVMLGKIYSDGNYMPRNYRQALEHYRAAAEKYSVPALLALGNLYLTGNGVNKNERQAFSYFKQAALSRQPEACYVLAEAYEKGYGVEIDYVEARAYYEEAADRGFLQAYAALGRMYVDGLGVQKNKITAQKLYLQGVGLGSDEARVGLAMMYLSDSLVEDKVAKAVVLLETAAEHGFKEGEYYLGKLYDRGRTGSSPDFIKALELYLKAAGHGSAEAAYRAGEMFMQGIGCMQDYQRAREMFELAVTLGDFGGYAMLGDIYFEGLGVEQDLYKAVKMYEKGGSKGDGYSYLQLGLFYGNEEYGTPDYEKAVAYLTESARLGNVEAMYGLGCLYHSGNEIEKDSRKAMKWYFKAAREGDKSAQYELGNIFEKGLLGQNVDYKTAYEWYGKAAQGAECLRRQMAEKKMQELKYRQ